MCCGLGCGVQAIVRLETGCGLGILGQLYGDRHPYDVSPVEVAAT